MVEAEVILYVLLGAVAGMIYGLRRIFLLEMKIKDIDTKIEKLLRVAIKKKKR